MRVRPVRYVSLLLATVPFLPADAVAEPVIHEPGYTVQYIHRDIWGNCYSYVTGPAGELYLAQWEGGADLEQISARGKVSTVVADFGYQASVARRADGMLFVSRGLWTRGLYRVDPSTGQVAWLSSAWGSLAFGPDGYLYVSSSDGIVRVDSDTGESTVIPVSDLEPLAGLAVDTAGNMYAAADRSLIRISPSGEQTTLASGLPWVIGIAVDYAGQVYATLDSGVVVRIESDGSTTVLATLNSPRGLAMGIGGQLIVFARGDGAFYEIDPTNGDLTIFYASLGEPRDVVMHEGHLYISSSAQGRIARMDPCTGENSVFATGLDMPQEIAFASDGSAYVAQYYAGVARVDPDGTLTTVHSGPRGLIGLEVDAGDNVYFTSHLDGTLYRIASDGTAGPFALFPYPAQHSRKGCVRLYGIALDPADRLWSGDLGCWKRLYRLRDNAEDYPLDDRVEHMASWRAYFLAFDAGGDLFFRDWPDVLYRRTPSGETTTFATGLNKASQGLTIVRETGEIYVLNLGDVLRIAPEGVSCVSPNQPPVALCREVTVPAGEDCTAEASLDAGSYDPDGDEVTLAQEPPGPYGLGVTDVELTVSDGSLEDTCVATVTVVDETPPELWCNAPPTITPPDPPLNFSAAAIDNCAAGSLLARDPLCYRLNAAGKWVRVPCHVSIEGGTVTIHNSGGVGTMISWEVLAEDEVGNGTSASCEVEVVNPGHGHCQADQNLDLAGWGVGWSETFDSCSTITASDFHVLPPNGDVTFRAGEAILLGDDFQVDRSCRFAARIEPRD